MSFQRFHVSFDITVTAESDVATEYIKRAFRPTLPIQAAEVIEGFRLVDHSVHVCESVQPEDDKARAADACERWNKRYPVGQPIEILGDGAVTRTRTRSKADAMDRIPMVWVENSPHAYALSRVKAVEGKAPDAGE